MSLTYEEMRQIYESVEQREQEDKATIQKLLVENSELKKRLAKYEGGINES